VASDKKRWSTKVVPDVPEPIVIGVTRACTREGVPKEPGVSGTTGTEAGGLNFTFDLGTPTGWALRTADRTIRSATVSFRQSRYDGGGMRGLRFRSWLGEFGERWLSAAA
jgi:hypothetical protein